MSNIGKMFQVRATDMDGTKTLRNLSGLRRDSEVMFVSPKDLGLDNSDGSAGGTIDEGSSYSGSTPRGLTQRRDTFGIFGRPGFGEMTFRRDSMAATLLAVENSSEDQIESIRASPNNSLEDSDERSEDEAEAAGFGGPIDMFLAGLGLTQYIKVFRRQKIDLETLMELDQQDLKDMNIEIGPRKKIMKAIEERRKSLNEDRPIEDSQL